MFCFLGGDVLLFFVVIIIHLFKSNIIIFIFIYLFLIYFLIIIIICDVLLDFVWKKIKFRYYYLLIIFTYFI